MTPVVPVRFSVRQALKDYLRHAVELSKHHDHEPLSLSEIVRRSIDGFIDAGTSPEYARAMVDNERLALDGSFTPRVSFYRYRDTPWVSLTIALDPAMLEAVRQKAARVGIRRDQLVRAAVFDTLYAHYDLPPNQEMSDAERGYREDFDGEHFLDPRHPRNFGREREAIEWLRRGMAEHPEDPRYYAVYAAFNGYMARLSRDYERFMRALESGADDDPANA